MAHTQPTDPAFGRPGWSVMTTDRISDTKWGCITGGAVFGVAVRMYSLGIQRRRLTAWPMGHVLHGVVFGYVGYWVWRYDMRMKEILAEGYANQRRKNAEREKRIEEQMAKRITAGLAALAEAESPDPGNK
ncbi:hypothetical protein DL96DRAFT_1710926 [Flagelloscypha sp. PMI_526]|nr:hypothetical protein DL96DRAFT_1710926 [Flagelloscypha sp. PMI_526]